MTKRNLSNKKAQNKRKLKTKNPHDQKGNRKEQLWKRTILTFLKHNSGQTFTVKQIAAETGLYNEIPNTKIQHLADLLLEEGQAECLEKGQYRYLSMPESATGTLEVTRSGVGFLLVENGADIFINATGMGKAMNGDIVKVRLLKRRKKNGRMEAEVTEVLHRARTEFVGTVEEGLPGRFFLLPDDRRINFDFYIPNDRLNGAKEGQKVWTRLLNWEKRSPEVEVLSILGEAGEHNTEMHAILLQYGFDPNFPPQVELEAEKIPELIPTKEIEARRDFRGVTTFTIDPIDAKDFDDALSLKILENGNYEVGVHIADVSYYVRRGSEIDREGFRRATSVYLVDRTVPMLPEKLSNLVCSLRPNEDKLTYSAVFELDSEARIHNQWIGRTVIHSDYRFHYEEAQDVLDGKKEGPYREELHILDSLAKKLRVKRMGAGSIEFESVEVKFKLDENGHPLGVIRKEMKDSNRLIEDFMLLANRRVAEYLYTIFDNPPLPSVYRIHDKPDPEKLSTLARFVTHFGYEVNFEENKGTSEKLNRLLASVQNTPEKNVIETIAIRSMAKAVYSTKNIGHFGLGFNFYTHFTSPIRRYPDLMVHRLLTLYGNKEYRQDPIVMEQELKHCSTQEKTAAEAERASIKYKQVEFLEDKIGQQFDGVISGVIESGIFVELSENMCEGFVPARTMENDYYVFDEENYCLRGKTTGEVFRLGDSIRVEIAGTDLKRRSVDMILIEKNELS
ncbi:MAG: ribonuclease R [Bacteroidia bacterium]|nr:ribonuclease R [Bacteroidia bacterium]